MVFLETRPVENVMASIYGAEGYFDADSSIGYSDYENQKDTLQRTFARYLATISRIMGNSPGSRMADIGCGKGYLLQEAGRMFAMTAGTDLSPDAVAMASDSCHVALCGGPDALIDRGIGDFDLITAVSVLEHVYKPVEFMAQCRSLLSEQGLLSVAVPWFGSFWQKVMGKRWTSFILPEHIAYYDRKSLHLLGQKSDLTLVAVLPYHHFFPLSLVLNKLGIRQSPHGFGKMGRYPLFLPAVMIHAVYRKSTGIVG